MSADKRRQMRNDYKQKPAVGAVYAITCGATGRRVVKSTVDIAGIRNRFQFAMATKTCPDPAWSAEWSRHGNDSFTLTVFEELTIKDGQTAADFADDIRTLLDMWLERLAAE